MGSLLGQNPLAVCLFLLYFGGVEGFFPVCLLHALVALTPFYISLFWALYFLLRGKPASSSHRLLGSFMASSAALFLLHRFSYLEPYALYLALDPLYTLTPLSSYPSMYWY